MLRDTTIDEIIGLVRRAAQQEILPRFRKLHESEVEAKSAIDDLVTIADKAVETLITESVRALLPDALIIGEEACAQQPKILNYLDYSELAVIIDPIDGTWNYANGLSVFGTIIAITKAGETIFGLLYDPLLDDWILAEKGSGASFVTEGKSSALHIEPPAQALTGFIPYNLYPIEQKQALFSLFDTFDRVDALRCSCHEYRLLAQGKMGFCISAALQPWDHAAGALVVEEAGGVARMIDGSPYRPGNKSGKLLTATDSAIFDAVSHRLKDVF